MLVIEYGETGRVVNKMDKEIKRVYRRAVELFKSGIAEDVMVSANGNVETPIGIVNPDGDIDSWFVGVTIGDKLVGHMRFDVELRFMHYSSFLHRSRSVDECPLAKDWLDSNTVLDLARTVVAPEDELMEPFFSYDRSPARIAWIVKFKDKDGKVGTVYVTGKYVYKETIRGPIRPGMG